MRFTDRQIDRFTDLAIHQAQKKLDEEEKERVEVRPTGPMLKDRIIMGIFESLESHELGQLEENDQRDENIAAMANKPYYLG